MLRSFPPNFSLGALNGPRAQQFTSRDDAFQQLIGDGLLSAVGSFASVAPTAGRDESIDVFIETGCELGSPFEGLPLPLIVECKDHDDTLGRVSNNIRSSWKKLEQILKRRASQSRARAGNPWERSRSYAYCVSARLNSRMRSDLKTLIESFFQSLPKPHRAPFEAIRVLDWTDLRFWLDSIPQVSVSWLGTGLHRIIPHSSYLEKLTGFRSYLVGSKLRFVPPEEVEPCHPIHLIEELSQQREKAGILLTGPGGVGKTRTAIEVAALADASGWAVFHIEPGEPSVTADDLADIVFAQNARTLLVFDYIDQMQALDLGLIRRTLIPQAIAREIHVAILANSRPGWMRSINPERDELFLAVPVHTNDSQRTNITLAMVDAVAPKACRIIGQEKLLEICGGRPIIALLIARELERRASQGILSASDTQYFRTGDLVVWLRQRLAEDSLCVPPASSPLLPSKPEPVMVAAGAALACAPGSDEFLINAAQTTLRSFSLPGPNDATHLIAILRDLGWLEPHGSWLFAAHDVVADEVIDQIVHDGTVIRDQELGALLAFGLRSPSSLGRFAMALRRVIGAANVDISTRLQEATERWFRVFVQGIGNRLGRSRSSSVVQAFSTVLAGPPWNHIAVEKWRLLFSQWFYVYGTHVEARHLLYPALHGASASGIVDVARATLRWLSCNRHERKASFVLPALLERTDISDNTARYAVGHALAWLSKHRDAEEASFVLHRLFKRPEITVKQEIVVIRRCLEWLHSHFLLRSANWVLHPLLERRVLTPFQAQQAITYALDWLGPFGAAHSAGFVLPALLQRTEFTENQSKLLIRIALSWLAHFVHTVDAEFVLRWLLRRADLPAEEAKQLIRAAIARVRLKLQDDEASFLLRWCLQRRINDPSLDSEVMAVALTWLDLNATHKSVDFVFNRLLRRPDLPEADWIRTAQIALAWLRKKDVADSSVERAVNSLLSDPRLLSIEDLSLVLRFALRCDVNDMQETDVERLSIRVRKAQPFLPPGDSLIDDVDRVMATWGPGSEFSATLSKLRMLVKETGMAIDKPFILRACQVIEARAKGSPGAAALAIPPLLLLSCEAEGVLKELTTLLEKILNDPRLSRAGRKKTVEAAQSLLNPLGTVAAAKILDLLPAEDS